MRSFNKIKLLFLTALLAVPLMVFQIYGYYNVTVRLPIKNIKHTTISTSGQELNYIDPNYIQRLNDFFEKVRSVAFPQIEQVFPNADVQLQVQLYETKWNKYIEKKFYYHVETKKYGVDTKPEIFNNDEQTTPEAEEIIVKFSQESETESPNFLKSSPDQLQASLTPEMFESLPKTLETLGETNRLASSVTRSWRDKLFGSTSKKFVWAAGTTIGGTAVIGVVLYFGVSKIHNGINNAFNHLFHPNKNGQGAQISPGNQVKLTFHNNNGENYIYEPDKSNCQHGEITGQGNILTGPGPQYDGETNYILSNAYTTPVVLQAKGGFGPDCTIYYKGEKSGKEKALSVQQSYSKFGKAGQLHARWLYTGAKAGKIKLIQGKASGVNPLEQLNPIKQAGAMLHPFAKPANTEESIGRAGEVDVELGTPNPELTKKCRFNGFNSSGGSSHQINNSGAAN